MTVDDPKKKQLEELRAARLEREARAREAEETARLNRDVADEVALAKAAEEHGPLGVKTSALKTDLGIVILKRPHHLEMRKMLSKGEKLGELDAIALVKSCLVHPTRPELETMLEELPAIGGDLMAVAMQLARGRVEEVSGKS